MSHYLQKYNKIDKKTLCAHVCSGSEPPGIQQNSIKNAISSCVLWGGAPPEKQKEIDQQRNTYVHVCIGSEPPETQQKSVVQKE